MDFYASKGWMVGKNKMKDWKAAVRTWERNSYDKPTATKPEPAQRRKLATVEEIMQVHGISREMAQMAYDKQDDYFAFSK